MNKAEALMLCRYAKACCPQQAFDDYTPDAWFDLLEDLRFEDCKAAVRRVAQSQPFVSPSEIRVEVRRLRSTRVRDFGPFDVPSGLDGPQYLAYIRDVQRRVADGELSDPAELALPAGTTRPRPEIPWADVLLSVDDA